MMHTIADIAIILGQSPELSLVVKMTIAAALGLAVVRFARAARASVRHLVLTSTFAALLALPLAMIVAPAIAIELPWSSTFASALASSPARTVAADHNVNAHAGTPVNADGTRPRTASDGDGISARANAQNRSGFVIWLTAVGRATGLLADGDGAMAVGTGSWLTRMPWLAMMRVAWLAGAAMLLGLLALGLVRVRGVRRTGLPWMERRDEAMRLARESGVNRAVTVLLHERIAAPLTYGWRNPVIVFPADAREWSDGDVRRVLLHELEHVRRGDWIVQLAARAICAIYWFHPLVWTAWRQLSLEAERACDDAVVKSEASDDGTDYAEQLVLLARRMSDAPAQPILAMASRSDLSARVTALLDQRQRRGRAGIMTFVAASGAAAIIVITIGPLRAVAADDTQASGRFIVEQRGSGTGDGTGHGAGSGAGTGSGSGLGSGSGSASGSGSGSGANVVVAAGQGAAVGGISGGVAGGAAGGVSGGVAGGAPGATVVGGVPGGVSGGVVGGVPAGVVGGVLDSIPGVVFVSGQKPVDEKRRVSRKDRALGEALIEAAGDGDVRALEELLAAGLDVNTKVDGDGSALIAAARKGQFGAIKFLLGRGADVNLGVAGDGNPLIQAAANGHTAVVTLLLEQGANIEAIVDGDENALIQAAANGQLEVVKLLVGRGANVNASVRVPLLFNGEPRAEERTPLNMARRGGHSAVVAFLQSAGATQ